MYKRHQLNFMVTISIDACTAIVLIKKNDGEKSRLMQNE